MTGTDGGAPDAPAERARSWVAHLRAGGSTPWEQWTGTATAGTRPYPPGPLTVLPGAQQLEVLRRVNAVRPAPPATADRVLAASALDRGRSDLPLAGGPRRDFGPLPVDPAQVPVDELLRVAVLLVADALPAAPSPASPPPPGRVGRASARLRRLVGGYRVVGDPWVSARVREELVRRGRPPGGRRPRVLVAAAPLPTLLAHTWTHQVLTTGAAPWADWVGAAAGRLPRGADVAGRARTWADRVGPARVVVVTDPARLGGLAGRGPLDPGSYAGLGLDAVELVRRVRVALAVVAPPEQHGVLLLERLRPALAALEPAADGLVGGPLPEVPAQHLAQVTRRAVRQHRRVARAGYAVAGDVGDLLAGVRGAAPDGPVHDEPDPGQVLGLAVSLLAAGLVPGAPAARGALDGAEQEDGGRGA